MNKRTAIIFYILSVYVVVQFIWWGYHLIELTEEVAEASNQISKRVIMILGEGAVFLLLLIVGIWQIHRSIRKDLALSERQKNFLLSVTHELKTPLAANKLYLQTITKRKLSGEQQAELIQKAIEENVRLERMIDNILHASRLENNALKIVVAPFSLTDLIKNIQLRFNAFLGENAIQIQIPEKLEIRGDQFIIETALNNLVENALKYAGKQAKIELYAFRDGPKVVFGVRDNGPGVPKEHQQEIFKKFVRIGSEETRTQKGSGLGLFIVSEFIRMHKGTVTYIDNQPTGANFQITMTNGN